MIFIPGLSQHQLFNIAKTVSGISLKEFCANSNIPVCVPSLMNKFLSGNLNNPQIKEAVEDFIDKYVGEFMYRINKEHSESLFEANRQIKSGNKEKIETANFVIWNTARLMINQ